CPAEVCPFEVGPSEVGHAEVRLPEVRLAEVRFYEICPAEICPAEVGPTEVRLSEACRLEVRPYKGCSANVRSVEVRPAEVRLVEVRLAKVRPAEVRPAEVRLAKVRPEDVCVAKICPAEVSIAKVCPTKLHFEVRPQEAGPAEVSLVEAPLEVRLAEARSAKVRPAEIWPTRGIRPPGIPGISPLQEPFEVFRIGHLSTPRIFLDNAVNYRKDDLQLKILSPGLGNRLATADGDSWRFQRRSLAPLFSPRQVAEFAPAMQRVAETTVERLGHRRDGAVADVGELTSRMALGVLEQTLFSQGLGREASEFQRAVTSYF